MKKIYIIFSHTGTILSRIIKYYTKNNFSHISLALDEDLEQMYSFGRLHPYNPFWGGFVHEGIKIGTFKRFKNTKSEVYSLEISDEQYEKIEKTITHFNNNKEKYRFNLIGLACVTVNKKIIRKNTFYCAEFVRHALKNAGIEVEHLPEIIKPEDFKKMEGLAMEYEGLLRKYKKKYIILEDIQKVLTNQKIGYV